MRLAGRDTRSGGKDSGRIVGGRDKSIIAMRLSVENTVKNSNGQIVQRTAKNKELRMTSAELEKLLASLLDLQGNRCALTGIPLHFHGPAPTKTCCHRSIGSTAQATMRQEIFKSSANSSTSGKATATTLSSKDSYAAEGT
jgi:hypothetical protein